MLIHPRYGKIRRQNYHLKFINFIELQRLGIRSSRHSRKLFIHSKKVLKRDSCHSAITLRNADVFFCLNCLM